MANNTYIFPQGDRFPFGGNAGDLLAKKADGGVEWKTPGGGVVITVEENQTVNGYQVPKMTADDVTRAYNAVVAAIPCTLTDAQENQHFAVNQADTVSSDICVNVLYYDKMLLTYTLSGETVATEYTEIGGGGINYSTTEQDTGVKWTNGKSIYVRTFVGTTTATGNQVIVEIASGFEEVIKMKCSTYDTLTFSAGVGGTTYYGEFVLPDLVAGTNNWYFYKKGYYSGTQKIVLDQKRTKGLNNDITYKVTAYYTKP